MPRELFCILTKLVAQRLGKPGVIEYPNVVRIQVRGHAFGMAKSWQSSLQNDPIKTRDNATNLVSMSFQQRCHAKPHTPRAYSVSVRAPVCPKHCAVFPGTGPSSRTRHGPSLVPVCVAQATHARVKGSAPCRVEGGEPSWGVGRAPLGSGYAGLGGVT